MTEIWWTPPKLAKRLGVCPERIIGWITAGELDGVNLAERTSSKPRYKVCEDAVQRFLRSRSAAAVSPTPKRRSRRTSSKREFYA